MSKEMVSIVIPENSVADVINAGLTLRYYRKKGRQARYFLVNATENERFWRNIKDFPDKNDRSLVILNFPVPSDETLRKIDLEPYEYSILYVPSELVTMTPQSRRILLEKGIVAMPQRPSYKCFPGEYTDPVERKWMKIGQIVSFEKETRSPHERRAIRGLLEQIEDDLQIAVQRISEGDLDFFEKKGRYSIVEKSELIVKPDLEVTFVKGRRLDLILAAFENYLDRGKIPQGIKGYGETVVLTEAPTLAFEILDKCDFETKSHLRFGKGAAIILNRTDDLSMGLLMGKLSQKNVFIRFGRPKFVVKKTLMRRLLGGKGPGGRSYRGLNEKYPEIEVKKDMISIPRAAFEDVVDTLRETGTEFEIVV